jgi:hypothetical protein
MSFNQNVFLKFKKEKKKKLNEVLKVDIVIENRNLLGGE